MSANSPVGNTMIDHHGGAGFGSTRPDVPTVASLTTHYNRTVTAEQYSSSGSVHRGNT